MATTEELDPVLAAMAAQFEAQAAFHAASQNYETPEQQAAASPASAAFAQDASSRLVAASLLARAQQQGSTGTGISGLLHKPPQAPAQPLTPGLVAGTGAPLGKSAHGQGSTSRVGASGAGPLPVGKLPQAGKLSTPAEPAKEAASANLQKAKEERAKREAEAQQEAERLRCHLHKRPKDSCKFCRKWQDFVNKGREDKAAMRAQLFNTSATSKRDADEGVGSSGPLELANPKTFGLPPLLQSHIIESQHFKSLMTVDLFEEVVEEILRFSDSVEPYMQHSATMPSALFCCLYRMLTLGLDSRQLRRLIDYSASPFVRCAGFLCVRFGLDPSQLWLWLGEYVLDEEEFRPTKDTEYVTTVGEYVESLLSQERYYNIVFPRVPMSTKRQLEAKLAQVPQFRKRTQANQRLLEIYRQRDVRIEACPDDSAWLSGCVVQLDESVSTRLKVHVRLDEGRDITVHIGKVILSDQRFLYDSAAYRAASSNRSRSPQVDWARQKGKSQAQLIDEQRSRDRDKAVCASGKEYARKPVGIKVACALPREMGAASHRLMEDETFVPLRRDRGRRSPSPSQQDAKKVQHSAEHQAQMQQLFEKYGMAKSIEATSQPQRNAWEGEGPDVMRLG